jgi:hypothetical protein
MQILIINQKAFKYEDDVLTPLDDGVYKVKKESEVRTLAQNRAYWLWATQISDILNNAGLTIPKVIKLDTKWDRVKIAELIFKPTIQAIYGKKSSTQLTKDEYDLFIDTVTKAFGSKGVQIPPFPSVDELILKQY